MVPKTFGTKSKMGQKEFCLKKGVCRKKIEVQKGWFQKYFGSKHLESKKFFVQNEFWSQKKFVSQKMLIPNSCVCVFISTPVRVDTLLLEVPETPNGAYLTFNFIRHSQNAYQD